MATYQAKFISGAVITFEDSRTLPELSQDLSSDGFLLIEQRASGYQGQGTIATSIIENSIETICVLS